MYFVVADSGMLCVALFRVLEWLYKGCFVKRIRLLTNHLEKSAILQTPVVGLNIMLEKSLSLSHLKFACKSSFL